MRLEAKHAESKKVSSNCGNFKNICKTIAIRHQMKQAYRFMKLKGLHDEACILKSASDCTVLAKYREEGHQMHNLLGNYGLYREIFTVKSVKINNVDFNIGHVLGINCDELFPNFGEIIHMFVTDSQELKLFCRSLLTIKQNRHLQAFQVVSSDEILCIDSAD